MREPRLEKVLRRWRLRRGDPRCRHLLTAPTVRVKAALKLFACRVAIVSSGEIRDPGSYCGGVRLDARLHRYDFAIGRCRTFKFGWNSLCVLRRA